VNAKKLKLIIGTAVALLLLVGAGVAYASGSFGDGSSGDGSEQSTGGGMEQAKSVALNHVNGRVTATEFQDEEGYYEVEVTKDDGTQVDVHLDKNYNVIDAQSDSGGSDAQDGANGSNDSGG
jgi:Peptidase propeptide and YPEB domain